MIPTYPRRRSGRNFIRFDQLSRASLFICAAAALCILSACSTGSGPVPRMNVIMLVVDTMRADHLGCYGYSRDTSPYLDGLSERSILFLDVTAQAPWTNPSVATLMTSLYPSSHHMLTLKSGGKLRTLDEDITTLAEVLHRHGYRTAAFTANPWLSPGIGFGRGFEVYRNLPLTTRANTLNRMAIEWVGRPREAEEMPFFLYIHYMDVHGPYDPPAPYDEFFGPVKQPQRHISPQEFDRMPGYLRIEGLNTLEEYTARYDGGIRYWDACLSVLVGDLEDLGLLDNSVLIVTSDHGEEFLEHGGFNHGSTLFQEQVRVPLLWHLPGGPEKAARIDQQVELVDVMPTLLSLLEVERPPLEQGDDVSPLFEGKSLPPRPAFSEAPVAFGGVALPGGTLKSVKLGVKKAIMNLDTGELSVYDLSEDPGESEASPEDSGEAWDRLLEMLRDWIEQNRRMGSRFEAGGREVDDRTREGLEALGYIDG